MGAGRSQVKGAVPCPSPRAHPLPGVLGGGQAPLLAARLSHGPRDPPGLQLKVRGCWGGFRHQRHCPQPVRTPSPHTVSHRQICRKSEFSTKKKKKKREGQQKPEVLARPLHQLWRRSWEGRGGPGRGSIQPGPRKARAARRPQAGPYQQTVPPRQAGAPAGLPLGGGYASASGLESPPPGAFSSEAGRPLGSLPGEQHQWARWGLQATLLHTGVGRADGQRLMGGCLEAALHPRRLHGLQQALGGGSFLLRASAPPVDPPPASDFWGWGLTPDGPLTEGPFTE